MALTLTVAGHDEIPYLRAAAATIKFNTMDFLLVDPSYVPVIGDAVATTNPIWSGTVQSVETADPMDKVGHQFVTVVATNTNVAGASAGPFALSDAPSPPTSYAYQGLKVRRTHNSDGTTTIAGSCTIRQAGLWPAMTFLLTSANQGLSGANFSVVDVTVRFEGKAVPVYHLEFGDPIVTMSVWVNSSAAGVLPITTTKITDQAVTTPKLAAGSVTADKLTAVLILATLIKAGAGPQHTEMDQNGFRAYDASGNIVVNIPNDGSPVTINANLIAKTLVATGNAIFQGTQNELALGSVTQLDAAQGDPAQAPALAGTWDSVTFPVDATYDVSSSMFFRAGLDYDSAGGAGGATKVFWTAADSGAGGHAYALELKASDRSVNRAIDLGPGSFLGGNVVGVVRLSSWIYVLIQTSLTGYSVYRYLQSTLAAVDSIGFGGPGAYGKICQDGSNIYIVARTDPGGVVIWQKYDTAMAAVGSAVNTGYTAPAVLSAAAVGNFDFGAFRILAASEGTPNLVASFDSAGAHQSNEDFATPSCSGLTYGDALADGARFWSTQRTGSGTTGTMTKHSTWVWTTASSIYWLGYTWYDSNATGGTHETKVSPRASITMWRRQQLVITVPPIPGPGGVDDPNNVRFYTLPNASDPGSGGLKLQATQSGLTLTMASYSSGGAADPGSNNFPAGSVALLKSGQAGFIYKGSGLRNLLGTSFPSGPVTGDHFWRSDLGREFFYDGTRWLSAELFFHLLMVNFSTTVNTSFASPTPSLPTAGGADFWLLDHVVQALVATTNNGTNYWSTALQKSDVANAQTNIDTSLNTSADTAGNWATHKVAINALLFNGTTYYGFLEAWTKTGAPGQLFAEGYLTYRLVAT